MQFLTGIDLGGTKIEIAVLDTDGHFVLRHRVPTPQGHYEATLETIASLVRYAEARIGSIDKLGIGTPGAISPASGLLRNSNSVCLNDRPIQQDLEQVLQRQVLMANDADCFALSEAIDGAGRGARSVWGIILGTGVGSGIVVRQQLLAGPNAIAGEWGHNPLVCPAIMDSEPLPACYCGRTGCIEQYLSGPGMRADHLREHGVALDPDAIVSGADQGDVACLATLQRYIERLASALGAVINILDPDVIVLGGGMGNIQCLYEQVPMAWKPYIFSDHVATRLLAPVHGDSSGVRGAAFLCRE